MQRPAIAAAVGGLILEGWFGLIIREVAQADFSVS